MDIRDLVDTAAEGGVIASLIYHPEFFLVDNNLREKFFYNEDNQVLYWGINKLISSGVTNIDGVNLRNILCSHPAVQKVADKYGLINLTDYIAMAKHAARGTYEEYKLLVTMEENVLTGGYGETAREYLDTLKTGTEMMNIGIPDMFVEHGKVDELLHEMHIDCEGIVESITEALK